MTIQPVDLQFQSRDLQLHTVDLMLQAVGAQNAPVSMSRMLKPANRPCSCLRASRQRLSLGFVQRLLLLQALRFPSVSLAAHPSQTLTSRHHRHHQAATIFNKPRQSPLSGHHPATTNTRLASSTERRG